MEVHPKTATEYVNKFFENYLPYHRGAILVMDNHAAHKSNALKEMCHQYRVKIAFLPSVSSNLNPIERLWSVVKAEWSKFLVTNVLDESQMERILLHLVAKVSAPVIRGINRSSHKLMVNVLDGHLV